MIFFTGTKQDNYRVLSKASASGLTHFRKTVTLLLLRDRRMSFSYPDGSTYKISRKEKKSLLTDEYVFMVILVASTLNVVITRDHGYVNAFKTFEHFRYFLIFNQNPIICAADCAPY